MHTAYMVEWWLVSRALQSADIHSLAALDLGTSAESKQWAEPKLRVSADVLQKQCETEGKAFRGGFDTGYRLASIPAKGAGAGRASRLFLLWAMSISKIHVAGLGWVMLMTSTPDHRGLEAAVEISAELWRPGL